MIPDYTTDTSLPPREQVRRALRSGKFEQYNGALERNGKFCCLGVACIVAELNGVPVIRTPRGELHGSDLTGYQPEVLGWLGMTDLQESTRIRWNDEDRQTFNRIARRF